MFIDKYSHYGYLYLIHEKLQSLDVVKTFKAEVENQLDKKIKAVKFDRCGESTVDMTDKVNNIQNLCQIPRGMRNRLTIHHARQT